MHFFRGMRTLLVLIAALALPAFAQGSIFPSKNTQKVTRQLEPANVSEDARAFLKARMKNHAKELKALSLAVATVDLPDVQRLAQDIANQARLDPSVGPAMKLPPRFFELQDELRKNAQALADAAKDDQLSGTQEKYAAVIETCMACHAAFRK